MRTSRLILLAAVAGTVVLGFWLIRGRTDADAVVPAAQQAVPVTLAPATEQDVPVYARGLGTVQAFNTVEVKAQVNGALVAIPVREGQEVQKGDIVAEIDPRPFQATLDQVAAQRAGDLAQLQSAQQDLRRYQDLAKHQFAPVQQVDDQQATVNKLVAAVQADTAAVETAQINLNFCTIRAPINGRLGFYQTDLGNLIEVASQAGIVSITQDKPISVVFTLPETQLPHIQDMMAKAKLPVTAFSSDGKTQLGDGVLATPNNAIDTTTATIQLKATFPNDNDKLWPGEFVNARLLVETLHHAVTVPLAAIQHGADGLFVYTVGPDNTVQDQAIEVAYQDADTVVIGKGLQANQNVVIAGQSRLTSGVHLTASPANAPPPVGGTAPAAANATAAGHT